MLVYEFEKKNPFLIFVKIGRERKTFSVTNEWTKDNKIQGYS